MTTITLYLQPHCAQYLFHLLKRRTPEGMKPVASLRTKYGNLITILLEEAPEGYNEAEQFEGSGMERMEVQFPERLHGGPHIANKHMVIPPKKMALLNQFVYDQFNDHMKMHVDANGRVARKTALLQFRADYGITEDIQPLATMEKRLLRMDRRDQERLAPENAPKTAN